MKMTLPMYLLFVFVSSWVIQDVCGSNYESKLVLSAAVTLSFAYLNNAHKIACGAIKRLLMRIHA